MLPNLDGADHLEVRTVYYAGTDKLAEGYALCYDTAASKTATDPKTRLGVQVVKPATAHLAAFAGVVAPQSDGLTGPCYVDIFVPRIGALVKAFTKANMTKFSTYLIPVDAQYALGAQAQGAAYAQAEQDALERSKVGLAAETVDTSATAANALIIFK
jgi:hypothetical protein